MRGFQAIYFIQAASGPVKIGIAADPVKRLMGIQSGSHELMALVCTIPGDRDLETLLHRHFAHGHIRGEWFRSDTAGLGLLISQIIEGALPDWLTGASPAPFEPFHRLCSCGWPIEDELAARGADSCWTCQREAVNE